MYQNVQLFIRSKTGALKVALFKYSLAHRVCMISHTAVARFAAGRCTHGHVFTVIWQINVFNMCRGER